MLIRARIQDLRFLRGVARAIVDPATTRIMLIGVGSIPRNTSEQSWVLGPSPNQDDSDDLLGSWIQDCPAAVLDRGSGTESEGFG